MKVSAMRRRSASSTDSRDTPRDRNAGSARSLRQRISRRGACLPMLLLAAVVGCGPEAATSPERIVKVDGDSQCGLPGDWLEKPLVVRVLGRRPRDLLGRRGLRPPVRDVRVTFRVERLSEFKREDGSNDESNRLLPYPTLWASNEESGPPSRKLEVTSDASGIARAWVRLGSEGDDWRVEAIIDEQSGADKEHFRLVSGVEKVGEVAEATVGEKVPLRLRLAELDSDGSHRPLKDRVVFFRSVGQPYGVTERATISNRRDTTDKNGVRDGTDITVGDRPGIYHVLAEIEPHDADPAQNGSGAPSADRPIRGILYEIAVLDWYEVAAKLVGGILLFLLGVRLLAGGFLLLVGPKWQLESGPWTERRLLGYATGGVMGAAFQSWSTVSTHLVSFANGGLLDTRRGARILVGASLGATVLPQVLSLDVEFLTIPLLALGLLCLLLPRDRGKASWGWVLVGGGLVLAGWSLLRSGTTLAALSDNLRREFESSEVDYLGGFLDYSGHLFTVFGFGLLCGFLLRTSNLVVIFALLMASFEIVGIATCVPLIVGAGLGSSLVLLARSSLKNHEARRLAAIGAAYHAVTAAAVIVLSIIPFRGGSLFLWILEWTTPGTLFHPTPERVGHHVAMAHSLHHLLGGALFLLAPRTFTALVDRWLPPRRTDAAARRTLDATLLPVPSLALRQVRQEVIYLTQLVQKNLAEAFDAFRYSDPNLADQVGRRQETVGGLHRDVSRFLVLVAENPLSRIDATDLEVFQSTAGSLLRIGECAELLCDLSNRRIEDKVESVEETDRELSEVYDLVLSQFDNVVTLLQNRDHRVEENIMKLVERLARFRTRLDTQWKQRIEQSEGEWGSGIGVHLQTLLYQEAFTTLFRVAGHLSHIALRMRILDPDRI